MSRPALGPIAVGDQVYICARHTRTVTTTPATVTKVGRVWVTLTTDSRREWRMRLDTQGTGDGIGYESTFATAAQLAYDNAVSAASKVLASHGIRVERESRWYGPDGTLALADLLRQATA